jgi:hypothetical protein
MTGQLQKTNSGLKRRPFLTPVWLAALSALIASSVAAWALNSARSTTLVVVRAEDAPLTAAGAARAAQLAQLFGTRGGAGSLEAIYVAPAAGGAATAAPLAQRLGLTPVVLEAGSSERSLARRALSEHHGSCALIIADRETVQRLVGSLWDGKDIAPIADGDYGTIYVVTVPRIGHANVLRVQY